MDIAGQKHVERIVELIRGAAALDDVLSAVVAVLQEPLELWHAHIFSLQPAGGPGQLLSTWSVLESVWVAGMEIDTSISPAIEQAATHVRKNEIVLVPVRGDSPSLVLHVLHQEGIAAYVSIPVHQAVGYTLGMTLASASSSALEAVEPGFYKALAGGVSAQILALAGAQRN
jgi:hypothetical protein